MPIPAAGTPIRAAALSTGSSSQEVSGSLQKTARKIPVETKNIPTPPTTGGTQLLPRLTAKLAIESSGSPTASPSSRSDTPSASSLCSLPVRKHSGHAIELTRTRAPASSSVASWA